MATAYIDGEVRLFDSSFNGRLSRSIEYQLCRVYRDTASEGNILVTVVPVPQQDDDSICGVMAIANGYHAICGNNLATLTYIQEEMRNHLASCMENELFTPFPTSQEPALQVKTGLVAYRSIQKLIAPVEDQTHGKTWLDVMAATNGFI